MIRGAALVAQVGLFICGLAMTAAAQDNASVTPPQLRGVGIDQRLNNQVPLDLKFRDETGQTVTLGSYFGKKPVILSLVYYTCPMLCTMAENGLLNALRDVKFNIGEQYQVVTVSIDPTETPEMAMGKKAVYVGFMGAPRPSRAGISWWAMILPFGRWPRRWVFITTTCRKLASTRTPPESRC